MDDVSTEDLARAVDVARGVRRAQPGATPFYCADRAVKEVFGARLGIVDEVVPPRAMPLYYRLLSAVEAALQRGEA